jgi:hypothetical protein
VHLLDLGEWLVADVPYLRKLTRRERLEAFADPGVKAFRDAYQLAQMEQRIGASATKPQKVGPGDKVRPGLVHLELKGPDAR